MKRLKLFSLLLLLLVSTWSVSAQNAKRTPESARAERPQRTPEERAKMRAEHMKQELNLTDDQAKAIEKDNVEFGKKLEDIQKKHREELEKLGKDRDARLKKVLTEDQMAKMYENRGRAKERMKMGKERMMMQRHAMKERGKGQGRDNWAPHDRPKDGKGPHKPKEEKLEKE